VQPVVDLLKVERKVEKNITRKPQSKEFLHPKHPQPPLPPDLSLN
jgi:hypothetical protein